MAKPYNRNKVVIIIVIASLVILSIVFIYYIVFMTYVTNAYCDNNGHFNFTIVNARPFEENITYKWHLDNPMSGKPEEMRVNGNYIDRYYVGNGSILLPGNSVYNITIDIPPEFGMERNITKYNRGITKWDIRYYDQSYYIMDIDLFNGNMSIYHYREQKPSNYWDYSTLPPKEYQWGKYLQESQSIDMDASGTQRLASAFVNVTNIIINVNLTIDE